MSICVSKRTRTDKYLHSVVIIRAGKGLFCSVGMVEIEAGDNGEK